MNVREQVALALDRIAATDPEAIFAAGHNKVMATAGPRGFHWVFRRVRDGYGSKVRFEVWPGQATCKDRVEVHDLPPDLEARAARLLLEMPVIRKLDLTGSA